jgi:hypothetical protein
MVSTQSMGMNHFLSGKPNHSPHSMPWASNTFSFGMPYMKSHLSSSVSSSYMNPRFGSRGMMPPYYYFSFGGVHIPQPNLMVGGWNPTSSGSNPRFTFPGSSAQMGGPSTSYIPVHLSLFHYDGSYKHFSHGEPPSNLWCLIQRDSVL